VSRLDDYKFVTVEAIYRRFGQLLMMRFPTQLSDALSAMKSRVAAALESKVEELNTDVRKYLATGDYLRIEHIFQEIDVAIKQDSFFVHGEIKSRLVQTLETYTSDLVDTIKSHYMKYEVKAAWTKQEHLWRLEKAAVVKSHVARTRLDELADQQMKNMIKRDWLVAGNKFDAKAKLSGFFECDPLTYKSCVSKFIDGLDAQVKRLRKVESKADLHEINALALDLPRIAGMLDAEHPTIRNYYSDLWEAVHETVERRQASCCQEQDMDSLVFLREARKLLMQRQGLLAGLAGTYSPHSPGAFPTDAMASLGAASSKKEGKEKAEADDASLPGEGAADGVAALVPSAARAAEESVFALPSLDAQLQPLIDRLNVMLRQLDVCTKTIDQDWGRLVATVDFKSQVASFEETLRFVSRLKQQANAIAASGQYLAGRKPSVDRAISKLSALAADAVRALDYSRPEEAVAVSRNLQLLCTEIPRVIDDDSELAEALLKRMLSANENAVNWIQKMENDLAAKGTALYAQAEKVQNAQERKTILAEVQKDLDCLIRLQEKLVAVSMRPDASREPPLVEQIKERIKQMEADMKRRLGAGKVAAEEIAEAVHTMYVTAFDLNQTAILKHAEGSIGAILQDCGGKDGRGLQEIGRVLEREMPRGSEIVNTIPHFAELTLIQFQAMTSGKTPEVSSSH